jgi:uncharacterized protein
MNVEVRVVPGAKKREIRRDGQGLRVKVISRPHEGKANQELVEYLASTFSVRKSDVRIVTGEKDRRKVVLLPVDQDKFDAILQTSDHRP